MSAYMFNSLTGAGSGLNYESFLQRNAMVQMQIPRNQPEPVAKALESLGRQASVPVLIDPGVPQGMKFRVWGSISPRPLSEALDILAPPARLEWRWIGGSIFVTPAPQFQIFYGSSNQPRVQVPESTQRSRSPRSEAPLGAAGPTGAAGPAAPAPPVKSRPGK